MAIDTRYPELVSLSHLIPSANAIEWRDLCREEISEEVTLLYIYGLTPKCTWVMNWVSETPSREVVFIEDRIEAFQKFKEEESSLFSNRKIHLRFWLPDLSIDEFTEGLVQDFPHGAIRIFFAQTQGEGKEEKFEELKLFLMRKSVVEEALHQEMMHYHHLSENLFLNFRRIHNSFDLNLWKDAFKGVPAVVCGAGPSLSTVKESLIENEERALIFAGGSTITALTSMGVMPHLTFAFDPNPEEFTRLAFQTAFNVPLIFGSRVEPNIFYSHTGPLGYFPTGTGGGIEEWLEKKLGIKDEKILKNLSEEALSVTTIALMAAIYLGCDPIIYAGIDLAFNGGQRYAPGVIDEALVSLEDKNSKVGEAVWQVDGKMTATKWIMERDVIEAVMAKHPDRTFIQATKGGLGFERAPIQEDIFSMLKDAYDLRGIVHENVEKSQRTIPKEAIEKEIEDLQKSFEKVKQILLMLVQLFESQEENKEKKFLLEMDLEEEVSYKIALMPAAHALTLHLQRQFGDEEEKVRKLRVYKELTLIVKEYTSILERG